MQSPIVTISPIVTMSPIVTNVLFAIGGIAVATHVEGDSRLSISFNLNTTLHFKLQHYFQIRSSGRGLSGCNRR